MNQWVSFNSFPRGPVKSGHICALYGVPVDWIVKFPKFSPATQYLDGDIVLGYQKTWLRFSIAPTRKFFRESSRTLKGRPFWEQTLQFKINWQSGQTDVMISNVVNHRWVFLVKEAGTGMFYVLGKPPVGAEVAVSYSNEQGTVTEFNATHQAMHRAPLYSGANRSVVRLVDSDGNFIVDAEGNYICDIGPAVSLPSLPSSVLFNASQFNNTQFVVI